MSIVTALCFSVLLLCGPLVDGQDLEKPDWKAMVKKLNELQNVVNIQRDRISLLETRNDMTDIGELHDLRDTVNNQHKRISMLEKRYQDLENIVTTQAKEIARQTELGDEKSTRISELQNRQSICEKRNRSIQTRLTKLIKFTKDRKDTMTTFNSEGNTKNQTKSLIRKGRLLVPDTGVASVDNIVAAFYAYLSNHVISPSGHHILTFDTVITNKGNAYHPHSGTFIAPRSGLYVFTWTIRMYGQSHHSTELLVNNNVVGVTYLDTGNAVDGSVSGIVVVHVNQGDDVLLKTAASFNGGSINSDHNGRSSFAGWALM
ncbi:uncharacterized protein LOC130052799 [Ostrea edulis]|uniref:uncharacterized protein LOC130052799 n=1 Tax=Ostrea edulis TaxID=37623 RepID=UPI0024AF5DFC|nr:uncharacterized protein LOC130052799 [Ostrea edulis]